MREKKTRARLSSLWGASRPKKRQPPERQGATNSDQPRVEKAASAMLPVRPPTDDEPRRPHEDFLSPKSLVLLVIAVVIYELYLHNPHAGVAAVAGITVLTLLWKIVG
jgi:hypothetical protein